MYGSELCTLICKKTSRYELLISMLVCMLYMQFCMLAHKHKYIYVHKKHIYARFPSKSGYKEIMENFTAEKYSENREKNWSEKKKKEISQFSLPYTKHFLQISPSLKRI